MVSKFSHKITLLSQNSKVLIIGTLPEQLNELLDSYFSDKEYIEFNENTSEILNDNLYSHHTVNISYHLIFTSYCEY